MKYLQIKSATSTELGECVLPEMEKPQPPLQHNNPYWSNQYSRHIKEWNEWKKHIESLPKFSTTCALPAGEWFEGEEDYQWYYWDGGWSSCSFAVYEMTPEKDRRKVIVPVEQKESSIDKLRKKMRDYFDNATPEEIMSRYKNWGYEFQNVEQKDEPKVEAGNKD